MKKRLYAMDSIDIYSFKVDFISTSSFLFFSPLASQVKLFGTRLSCLSAELRACKDLLALAAKNKISVQGGFLLRYRFG